MSGFATNRTGIIHYMSPAGGGVDDSPRVQAAATDFSYRGKVVLRAGDWNWATPCTLPSGSWIEGTANTKIISTLTATGGPGGYEQSVFRAFIAAAGVLTSITVQANQGDTTLTISANTVAVGDTALLLPTGVNNVGQTFVVTNKSGTGPYVLVLDRPVEFKCLIGSSVQSVTTPKDIVIAGNGMEIQGTGDRAVELGAAENCVIQDLNINASFESIVVSFDVAGYRNRISRIRVRGDNLSASGVALECQVESIIEDCHINNCGITNPSNSGIYVTTSKRFLVRGCIVRGGMIGCDLDFSSAPDEEGCENGSVTDCQFLDTLGAGLRVMGGKNIFLSNLICKENVDGIQVLNNVIRSASNIYLNNIVVESSTNDGFILLGTNIRATNIQATSCVAHAVNVHNDNLVNPSSVFINGLTATSNGGNGIFLNGSAGDGSICHVTELNTRSNVGAGVKITGSVGGGLMSVDGWQSIDDGLGGLEGVWNNIHPTGILNITNAKVRNQSSTAFWAGIVAAAGSVTNISKYRMEMAGGTGVKAFVDIQAAGTLRIDNLQAIVTGGTLGFGIYAAHAVACKIWIGDNVDLTAATTPYTFDSFALTNQITFHMVPAGGGTDDAARVQAALSSLAYRGKVILGPGIWNWETTCLLEQGAHVEASGPGTHIVGALALTGVPPYTAIFSFDHFNDSPGATVLDVAGVAGQKTISVTGLAGLTVVGDWVGKEIAVQEVTVGASNQTFSYQVKAASGTGPYTLTLDRPLLHSFADASNVYRITRGRDVRLIGNGARISGTADRAISLVSAWNAYVENWEIDASEMDGEYACTLDTGSYESDYVGIVVHSTNATGLALEGCESCRMTNCYVDTDATDKNNAGILLQAAYNTIVDNCHVTGKTGGSGAGLLVGWVADIIASRGVKIINSSFNGNLVGIDISGSSHDVEINGCDCSYNTNEGIRVQKQSATLVPGRVRIIGGTYKSNGGVGVLADGVKGVKVFGAYFKDNTLGNGATINGGQLSIIGCEAENNIASIAQFKSNSATDVVLIESTRFFGTPAGGISYGVWIAAGNVTMKGVKYDYAAGTQTLTCVVQTAGTFYVEDVEDISGIQQTNGYLGTGGHVRRGPKTNFARTNDPWTVGGTAQASFGSIALNGATPVNFAFTDIKAHDRVFDRRRTVGGTPATYIVVVNAGVGVTLTGTAGDTSTIEIDIQ